MGIEPEQTVVPSGFGTRDSGSSHFQPQDFRRLIGVFLGAPLEMTVVGSLSLRRALTDLSLRSSSPAATQTTFSRSFRLAFRGMRPQILLPPPYGLRDDVGNQASFSECQLVSIVGYSDSFFRFRVHLNRLRKPRSCTPFPELREASEATASLTIAFRYLEMYGSVRLWGVLLLLKPEIS